VSLVQWMVKPLKLEIMKEQRREVFLLKRFDFGNSDWYWRSGNNR
jgi:hypothetical protein